MCSTLEKLKDGPPKEYEELIQKLEGDVRMHIRVEQQMRLHIENLQQRIEDLERENTSNLKKVKLEMKELKTEKKRLTELLNIKDEQLETAKRTSNDTSSISRYKKKLKDLEYLYEARISELVEELHFYKNRSHLKPEKSNLKNPHCASTNTFGRIEEIEIVNREECENDTDIDPPEELSNTERQVMVEKAKNIGNDSLLISFYKKKLDDNHTSKKLMKYGSKMKEPQKPQPKKNYTHRTSGPLRQRDVNVEDKDSGISNSMYCQSSSQRQISGYIAKHYQIPKKERSVHMETQYTAGSEISESIRQMQSNAA